MRSLPECADYLSQALIRNGFIVHRYNATSTKSIYLKVDYGVCHSIRISDHGGKKHLKYRYNINSNTKRHYVRQDKFERKFYSVNELDLLLEHILEYRSQEFMKLGIKAYKQKCNNYRLDAENTNQGFWSTAWRVEAQQ